MVQRPREGRLRQIEALGRAGQALLLHDGRQVFQRFAVQVDLRHRLRSRTGQSLRPFRAGGGGGRGLFQQLAHKGRVGRLVAGVHQPLLGQEGGQVAFGLAQPAAQRVAQVQGLPHRRVERAVNQLVTGRDMDPADQPHPQPLVQHRVHQQHVVRLEGHHRRKARLLEQLFCQNADAVPPPRQHEGSVPQAVQPDGLLPGQRVGRRQTDQQFLMGHRDVGGVGAGGAGPQSQVDLPPRDGGGLLDGQQLGQAEGDVRVAAGEGPVDLAVDDGPAVGGGGQANLPAAAAHDRLHGQEHPALLVQYLLGALDRKAAHRGGVEPAAVPQKERKAEAALALGQKLAQGRRRDPQRLRRAAQVAAGVNGGQVIVLAGVHGLFLLCHEYTASAPPAQSIVSKML